LSEQNDHPGHKFKISVNGTVGLMIVVDHVVISEQGRLMISHLDS